MIPQEYIDKLLQQASILKIIGSEMPLSRHGRNHFGMCPFHHRRGPDDKELGFTVSESKSFYHCFQCGAHGTVIGFIMAYRSLSFPEAVSWIAETVGCPPPEETGAEQVSIKEERSQVMATLDAAAAFYALYLREAPVAIDFLKALGINGHTAKKFRIGYAAIGWDTLRPVFSDTYEYAAVQAGIVIKNKTGRCYDKLRDRLIFPVMDSKGKVNSLIGLSIATTFKLSVPKYLRTSATVVTNPASVIFGWAQADRAIVRSRSVIVVHDCLYVLALSQNGFDNVVATPGSESYSIKHKYTEAIFKKARLMVCCFKATGNGFRAAWKTLLDALPYIDQSHEIRFAMLPDGADVCQLLAQPDGPDEVRVMLGASVSLFDLLLQHLSELHDMSGDIGRAAALAEFSELCKCMPESHFRRVLQQRAEACFVDALELIRAADAHDKLLVEAISTARRELTIMSPWISRQGISRFDLCLHIRAAVGRGVKVSIYTDVEFNQDRKRSSKGGDLFDDGTHEKLVMAGADVMFVNKVHSKWVLRDDSLLCVGSFNWLSAARHGRYMRHEISVVHRGATVPVQAAQLLEEVKARITQYFDAESN